MTSDQPVHEFELEIESDIEPASFSRILATLVNGSPVHLARVVVGGTVVYPTSYGSLFDPFTVRACRFRVRDAKMLLSTDEVAAILARVGTRFSWTGFTVVDHVVREDLLAS